MRWFLLFMMLLFGAVYSQERLADDIQKSKAHADKPTKKAKEEKQGTEKNPLFVKHIDAGETPERREQMRAEREEKGLNEKELVHWTYILAVATIVLSAVTFILASIAGGQLMMFRIQLGLMKQATIDAGKAATSAKESAEATAAVVRLSKDHERANIVCGGLFGVPKHTLTVAENLRPKADYFKGPWRMMIHNHGRTPGFVTKIEHGMWPKEQFNEKLFVSKIIKDNTDKESIKIVTIQDVFAPTGRDPLAYRYVEFSDRPVNHVFFGRISYNDIFGDHHHSTFALLLGPEHSETIGDSYTKDRS